MSLTFKLHHYLHSLPFQFERLSPRSNAITQNRTLLRMEAVREASRTLVSVVFFDSWAEPHYFVEKRSGLYSLKRKSIRGIHGFWWNSGVNYFRDWWLLGGGISFLKNGVGWGNGFQHEVSITLSVREKLLRENLDIQLILWADFWMGRNRYVWDPVLSLGVNDHDMAIPQDKNGILNFEIKGIVSTAEISFTMMNVLFAGRTTIRSFVKGFLSDEQLTFSGTPFMPSAGRLAFLTVRWRFWN